MSTTQSLIALNDIATRVVAALIESPDGAHNTSWALNAAFVSSSLYQYLRYVARAANARAQLVALPPRVLGRIAEHLPLSDRMIMARTCHALRRTLLSFPELWARLLVQPWQTYGHRAVLELVLQRSYPHTIHISLTVTLDDTRSLNALTPQLSRLRSLSLTFYTALPEATGDPTALGWNRIEDLLCRPAPILEELSLQNLNRWHLTEFHPVLGSDLLARQPGRLRKFALRGIRLADEASHAALRHLHDFEYAPYPDGLSTEDVSRILAVMPELRRFVLNVDTLIPSEPPIQLGPGNLEEVTIYHPYIEEHLFDYFEPVPHFVLCVRKLDAANTQSRLGQLVRLDLGMQGTLALYHTRAGTARVRVQMGRLTDVDFLGGLAAHAHLTTLNMQEWQWCKYRRLPPMPQLRQLTICLASCAEYHAQLQPGSGYVLAGVWQADLTLGGLDCPALQELHFAALPSAHCEPPFPVDDAPFACCCDNGCTLALHSVERFIRSALPTVCREKRLPRLVLSGVRSIVDADPAAAFAALQDLAENIDFGTSPPDHLRDLEEWQMPDVSDADWAA